MYIFRTTLSRELTLSHTNQSQCKYSHRARTTKRSFAQYNLCTTTDTVYQCSVYNIREMIPKGTTGKLVDSINSLWAPQESLTIAFQLILFANNEFTDNCAVTERHSLCVSGNNSKRQRYGDARADWIRRRQETCEQFVRTLAETDVQLRSARLYMNRLDGGIVINWCAVGAIIARRPTAPPPPHVTIPTTITTSSAERMRVERHAARRRRRAVFPAYSRTEETNRLVAGSSRL